MKVKYILLLVVLLAACGDERALIEAFPEIQQDTKRFEDLAYIKDDLSNHIGIYNGTLDLVSKIINAVHKNTTVRANPPEYDWYDFRGRYDGAFYNGEPHLCGGLAFLGSVALRAYDIPSRYVGLYNSVYPGYWSHATLEAYVPEHGWIIADPTFGSLAINNSTGMYMSWQDVREGEPVRLSDESHRSTWDIWAEAEITNYIIRYPATAEGIEYPTELIPEWWDGVVNGVNILPTGYDMYSIIYQ